jgi:UDP:flavonoid glycosyltransferase YjiC (YdhE family)
VEVLFSALPAYGHIFPLVPLALAVQNAGHDVLFATGADFEPVLRRRGGAGGGRRNGSGSRNLWEETAGGLR